MSVAVVRYQTKPDRADENQALDREGVRRARRRAGPTGCGTRAFRLADGVSFVHVASVDTDDGTNPLTATPAFAEFLREIADRCEEGPLASDATVVGSYRFWSTDAESAMTADRATERRERRGCSTTPSGGSEFTAYRDETLDPPALVVQVGKTSCATTCVASTTCTRCWSSAATGCRSATPTSRSPRPRARSRRGVAPTTTRSAAGTA